jgi:glutamine synthetase
MCGDTMTAHAFALSSAVKPRGAQISRPSCDGRPGGQAGFEHSEPSFAAGPLHHADALAALAALCVPTVNSYKRLAGSHSASDTIWSPMWKISGDNDRTCLV